MSSKVGTPPTPNSGWGVKQICGFDKVTWAFGSALIITGIALFILDSLNMGSFHAAALATISTGGGALLLGLMTHCCLRLPCGLKDEDTERSIPKVIKKPIPLEKSTKEFFEENGIFGLSQEFIEHIDFLRECRFAQLEEKESEKDAEKEGDDEDTKQLRQINGSMILHGPPGSGKTVLAKCIGTLLGGEVIFKGPGDHRNKFVGSTEENINKMFDVPEGEFRVLIIDELDAMVTQRIGLSQRDQEVGQILSKFNPPDELDEDQSSNRLILIGTTNQLHLLDDAFKRSQRAGYHFFIDKPNEEARAAIFKHRLARINKKCSATNWDELAENFAKETNGFSYSDIKQVFDTCLKKRTLDKEHLTTSEDVFKAIEEVSRQL